MSTIYCDICPHHCKLPPNRIGYCRARTNRRGHNIPTGYGVLSAVALDPIEKKPFARFMPGSQILSVGFFGCNMRCPFCQNHEISQREPPKQNRHRVAPRSLLNEARSLQATDGNIGIAYTYSEPIINVEYLRDTAKLVREAGMVNVLVTNGQCSDEVMTELLPLMDAVNVDLKGFRPDIYKRLGGDFETTKRFIEKAVETSHVEVTSLIVPGISDKRDDMRQEVDWLAGLDAEIPLHLTRYFPMFRMKLPPTDKETLEAFRDIAAEKLKYVYLGNV